MHVHGLFVNKQFRFLGATPDGIVYVKMASVEFLEVLKCPYSASLDQAISELPVKRS